MYEALSPEVRCDHPSSTKDGFIEVFENKMIKIATFRTPGVKLSRLLRFWEPCDLPLQPWIHPLGEL